MVKYKGDAVVTIDIGSGSCRALIWDEDGKMLAMSQEEWEYDISDYPGGLDFNTDRGWDAIKNCVQGALDKNVVSPEQVKAVSATSMREGFVVYDADGNELWAVPNVDARASKQAEELLAEGHGDRFYEIAGDWTSLAASARLRWIKENDKEVWDKAAHITMLADWALYKLSGVFFSDPSLGSSSALFDLRERQWSEEIAKTLEIDGLLPTVYESGTVIGEVTNRAAKETGLLAGTPVVAGGADTQLAYLGAGLVENKQFGIAGGTYWLASGIVDEPMLDDTKQLRTLCHAIPGTWMIEGCGFAHGFSTRWVRDGLLRSANPDLEPGESWDILTEMAKDVPPGSNGVHYFASNVMNTRVWKHPVPSVVGLDPFDISHTSLPAVFRAAMEEATYVARGHKELVERVWQEPIEEIAFVGGPTRSDLWCQMVADALNVKVRIPDTAEATCLGAAMCAWVGAGKFKDLKDAVNNIVKFTRYFEPIEENVEKYNELYPKWRALNDHMVEAADKGLAPYMWIGAGAASPESMK